MLNTAPDTVFSSLTARQAAAHAIDRERLNAVRGLDIPTIAAGPFGPGSMGFLEDSGYPEYDLEKAKELVAQYEQEKIGRAAGRERVCKYVSISVDAVSLKKNN